jgi:hypothetical protein
MINSRKVPHQENMLDRLAPDGATKRLAKQQVERIAAAIGMLQSSAAEVYQRPAATMRVRWAKGRWGKGLRSRHSVPARKDGSRRH